MSLLQAVWLLITLFSSISATSITPEAIPEVVQNTTVKQILDVVVQNRTDASTEPVNSELTVTPEIIPDVVKNVMKELGLHVSVHDGTDAVTEFVEPGIDANATVRAEPEYSTAVASVNMTTEKDAAHEYKEQQDSNVIHTVPNDRHTSFPAAEPTKRTINPNLRKRTLSTQATESAPELSPHTTEIPDTRMAMMPEPESEPEPEAEPENGPDVVIAEPTPKGESSIDNTFAEPTPEWTAAKSEWGIAWYAHIYCFGGTFLVLAVYSLWNMIRICSLSRLLSRYYFLTLNFLMFGVCFFRAFYLIYDPYNSSNLLQPILAYFLFNTGFPFFTSSFAVLFLSLLQATRLQMLSPKIQRSGVLAVIVTFHFIFSIATDIIVGTVATMSVLATVCQMIFITWAIFLAIGYFYIFQKLYKSACRSQAEIMRSAFTSIHISGGKLPKKFPRPSMGSAVKVTLISAIFALLTAILQVYGLVHVYGFVAVTIPQPWPWWIYQTVFRILEVCMCSTMIYVGARPLRHFGSKLMCPSVFRCCQEQKDFFDGADVYPAQFSGHLQPIMTDRADGVAFSRDHSLSLPGYAYRGNYIGDLSGADPSSKTLQIRYVNAPTSNASVISAISNHKSNSFLPTMRSDGVRSNATLSTAASGSRPSSMLIKDNGFIRFRQENETDEGIGKISETGNDRTTSPEGKESLKPQIGSMPDESALNDEISYNNSPFFRNGYKPYYQYRTSFASACSADTTDFDGSDEQLSDLPVKCLESNQRLRKCGSTCSSESAGNSFDLSMFLNRSVGVQTNSSRPISVALSEDSRYRPISAAVTEDGDSVDGHEAIIAYSSRPEGLNLDLKSKRTIIPLHVINSPMQDITPDSAVYLDLNISKVNSPVTYIATSPTAAQTGSDTSRSKYKKHMSCSQSMGDLTKRSTGPHLSSYQRLKKSTESLISRLKGSTFSLNVNLDGYRLLGASKEDRKKLRRTSSDHRTVRPFGHDTDEDCETLFIEDCDDDDGDDSGAGGSREDITMTDEEVQTDPVVILQAKQSKCLTSVSIPGISATDSIA